MAMEQKPPLTPSDAAEPPAGRQQGVLLYYKYVDLAGPVREEVASWMEGLCLRLRQVGRVRVAFDGVNVTVGGGMPELEEHIRAVKDHPLLRGSDIDFKLAASEGAACSEATAETGFTDLRVNRCEELVTLGPKASGITAEGGGRHASPREFHSMLEGAAGNLMEAAGDRGGGGGSTVVIDTRNCYETRIGHFSAPGAELLDPMTRQFSDFPAWVDGNQERLRGRRILMYCTGGVRCERASAYVRSKGDGFQDVTQLSGGIQRYLEAFPDSGFFTGKNFVFDERLAVGGESPCPRADQVVGRCMKCSCKTDDYTARLRCRRCRLLLLICHGCAASMTAAAASSVHPGAETGGAPVAELPLCELCTAAEHPTLLESGPDGGPPATEQSRKLRILCLHGFRQTSKKLQGRTAALRKKLGGLAEFVFVDAPHELPFWYKPPAAAAPSSPTPTPSNDDTAEEMCRDGDESQQGHLHDGPADSVATIPSNLPQPGHPKRAWLVTAETFETVQRRRAEGGTGPGWELAPSSCAPGQHNQETEGWEASWRCLASAIESEGPFDGIMGFSQGAAVAGYLCLLQHVAQSCGRNGQPPQGLGIDIDRIPLWTEVEEFFSRPRFRFAWICSGYPLQLGKGASFADLSAAVVGPIDIPSLHVHGIEGQDGQIGAKESSIVASAFERSSCSEVVHPGGHMIPCSKPYMTQYKSFLQACLRRMAVMDPPAAPPDDDGVDPPPILPADGS